MPDAVQLAERIGQDSGFENLAPPLQIALFLGAMVFLSSALVCLTAFTRIVIVMSMVRRALSTNEIPPTPVLLGLSMFLTFFVMGPTLDRINEAAVQPYVAKEMSAPQAVVIGMSELQRFMLSQTRKQELALFIKLGKVGPVRTREETPLRVLIPAFITSELKTAFIMGFCIYIPFIVIDLVVSTVLMSLGMMMMPPVTISTPFKILLFVLVDGWQLVARALSSSFA